ncbi:ATP-binding cassette domain-containing protein [Pseudomonas plecoglossicida]|uniref:iron ABC transporter ATP-binding protein n=1 Tax=Pseudomonas plecoglossicida TaxID=70775 RepID=UPI0015E426BC|nr:ATP-binding cassette domain-containing protein [Pseudomonas plecoglossicida]MBA1195657.1 ATP-binding cassette domain-containing protein [Pseudomonas plecoglossicida]
MITVHDLHKSYAGKTVLDGVDLSFPRGQLTSLIGPNGAGKSTLLMTLARLLQPSQGEVRIDGQRIADIALSDFARQVATLRQSPDFNLRLTVEELVAFGRFPHCRGVLGATDVQAIEDAISFLALQALRHAYIDELSGGQRQMAFLAMTIAQQTDYLLLDEPLNNLDISHAVQIMRALRRLCDEQRRTVILVVHDINFAASYSDHIVAMRQGRVHSVGSVGEVVTEACMSALYGLDFEITQGQRGRLCNYFNPA